ncbi:MAG TPA: hypothetical protein VHE99_06045 [Gammaproteobacteria bacterium]|nr:hypothetical protein [Gammaproteobacteria bacterium]
MNTSVQYLTDKEMEIVIGGGAGPVISRGWKGWHFWEPRNHPIPVDPPVHIW